jgi:hypothetical protein
MKAILPDACFGLSWYQVNLSVICQPCRSRNLVNVNGK